MSEFGGRKVEKRQRIGALLYRDGPSSHEVGVRVRFDFDFLILS